MSQRAAKPWGLRLLPLLLFLISFATYYYSYVILQSSGGTGKALNISKSLCGGLLTQKNWERLNLNITRHTQLFLKMEDFFWKETQSKLPLPYGIKGSELMLLKVLAATNYQMPTNIENLECRTCVVIGNGYVVKNSSLGSLINKYDVVIRLNDAPVRGYEDDVGNKTTMRFFYPESAYSNPILQNDPDTLMVMVPFKMQDLRWLKEILYNEKRVRKGFWKPPPLIWLGDPSKTRVLDPHIFQQAADNFLKISNKKGKNPVHPTTGMLAVVAALNYCDVVHIAGFGYPSLKKPLHPIHYYGRANMKSMMNSYHDINNEAKALRRLEESGAILYLHPHL
ncbi:CMP-N-acetylneuraminate-beta-galactosamide-alpha-2,3-sialyltransferase 4 isoform X2 [Austrofundulus limnaeus]|uniref:CMP-N-acetylneuraminate-beta-galactosamide-alpha-2,3-sialyltransferase 4 n=1 Tax=Austrofundulus limnaeus TaxID=52670 RepID=A0A2I4CTQ5_AUSLI|nr:PREDICTED: CMP-N-acetylneuraminate-beta-galactosamide-alpha-2,3-sialyltransferase 4 isoform X2 [Austrofundulus limnaeus]XP_013883368.1 PREDICTED: CMP-N-acetylneuraminate-beta-galactosamide-alpha-2,3-sialyltransferase 4 isoform X2 [Austrofundulus limnaeus]XP_013883369.1 PREDICTED: CMP-N-acetylneuraminate-beta-galactosamide-alpha-2,3-sialyltransferase 4 isoform X2 [Austrofundulus limnaeus]XP_013883370.1 PREDICTED: CMP-N-acetylneuraminate-beta-galactosamide-alpha-2,3-sialyltransferase 4 isoform 